MNIINEMRLDFQAMPENEAFARIAISGFVLPLNPTIEDLADIKTAVSEAVTNAIIHGYGNKNGIIRICATYTKNGFLTVDIKDKGCGIRDIEHARQPFYTTSESEERSGMGFTVMESFMDSVEVRSIVGKGTTVRLTKQIDLREENLACNA